MKKQYISPLFIEVNLQGVGIIASSEAHIGTNANGDPYGEGIGDFGGDDDAWNNAGAKTLTNIWDVEW